MLSRDDLDDGFEFNEFNWITVSSVNGSDLVRWCIGWIVKQVDEIKLAAVWPHVDLFTLLLLMLFGVVVRKVEELPRLCVVVAMGNDKARWWLTDVAAAKIIPKKNCRRKFLIAVFAMRTILVPTLSYLVVKNESS